MIRIADIFLYTNVLLIIFRLLSLHLAMPNSLELSCPAEAGRPSPLYGEPAGRTSASEGPARRVSFSELLGGQTIDLRGSLARVHAPDQVVVLGDEVL